MEFPRLVYKAPGRMVGPKGAGFDCIAVDDEEEFKLFKGKGWHETLPAAFEAAAREESLKKLQEMDKKPVKK